jgi:hypothetical protein
MMTTDHDVDMLKKIQSALIGFETRAEKVSSEKLTETFVDAEPLFALLSSPNHQVMFGRRGTGKTHALRYLADYVTRNDDVAIYIDLRTIGSNGSIYSDAMVPLEQRATTLVTDVLVAIYDALLDIANNQRQFLSNPIQVTNAFDAFADVIGTVKVVGDVQVETSEEGSTKATSSSGWGAKLGREPSISADSAKGREVSGRIERRATITGKEVYYVQFGAIQNALNSLLLALGTNKVWLLLDEWSEIPVALQPYLADLIRRTILPVSTINVKVAAIEHRSNFVISRQGGEYVGIELGADAGADLNLDDFMVFDNDSARAVDFFKNLIFKHFVTTGETFGITSPDELIQIAFKQAPVFEEFVRASEGVPRDAIYLMSQVARAAFGDTISMSNVRTGARQWYSRDKASVLKSNRELSDLLNMVIDDVIGHRKARAFLFRSDARDERIDRLFDNRLLHILKKSISDRDNPGVRYDVYKLDYGCYVDLINTSQAPVALLVESPKVRKPCSKSLLTTIALSGAPSSS